MNVSVSRKLNNGVLHPRKCVRYFGIANLIRTSFISEEWARSFSELDTAAEMENAGSFFNSGGMRHLAENFIAGFASFTPEEQNLALHQFIQTGQTASPPMHIRHDDTGVADTEHGSETALVLLKMGMDGFQPWKRRVYGVTLLGFR